ncbi:MAG: cysteine hydrolase [Dehalococcoidia bacterium]|nr:cysteine hydrolase [Dehalococcoidia bacterium]
MSAKSKVYYPVVPHSTAMIVIDMQNDFVSPSSPGQVPMAYEMVPRLNSLLDACHTTGIPVIFVRAGWREGASNAGLIADFHPRVMEGKGSLWASEGHEIYQGLHRQPEDFLLQKPRYSPFYGTDLETILRPRRIDTLIIGGTVTNLGCEQAARDAFCRDYKVIFLSDGTGTRDWPDLGWGPISAADAHRFSLTLMAYACARVASVEEVLQEIK